LFLWTRWKQRFGPAQGTSLERHLRRPGGCAGHGGRRPGLLSPSPLRPLYLLVPAEARISAAALERIQGVVLANRPKGPAGARLQTSYRITVPWREPNSA